VSGKLAVSFTPRAAKQVDEAAHWWQQNRPKAPAALSEDLEAALELISTQPLVGAIARNIKLRNVRRVYLNRIGYYLYYRFDDMKQSSDGEAKFWLSPSVELAENHGLAERDIRILTTIVQEHEQEIREAWKRHFEN
jgi:hypothetical protein